MNDKPRTIRWSLYCLAALIVLNLAALLLMLAHSNTIFLDLFQGMQQINPSASTEKINAVVHDILLRRNFFHALVIVCWAVLGYLIYKGKNWGLVLLVAFTVLSFVGSIYAFSTAEFITLQVIAVVTWVGRIVLLWLLLVPESSRRYFRPL